jgi:hypothetical protein
VGLEPAEVLLVAALSGVSDEGVGWVVFKISHPGLKQTLIGFLGYSIYKVQKPSIHLNI